MYKSENTGYKRQREFLFCTDVGGSAVDLLSCQQKEAYLPALLRIFELENCAAEAREIWMNTALYTRLRGGNRFRLLAQACVKIAAKGITVPDLADLMHWVESGSELTHGALAARVKRGAGPGLGRVLEWSREVNRCIAAMPKAYEPFPSVPQCLAAAKAVADVVAVDTGTFPAVRGVWNKSGLMQYTSDIYAASNETKAEVLVPVFAAGYQSSHMLVVGDTLEDAAIAEEAGALFFPILPGREEECWHRLYEEGLPKFLHGSFEGAYSDKLRKAQRSLLP